MISNPSGLRPHLPPSLAILILVLSVTPSSYAVAGSTDIQSLVQAGELDQALVLTEQRLQKSPGDAELQFLRGLILTKQNKLDAAEEQLLKLTQEHPDLPEPYNNLAVIYAAKGKYDEARATLLKAINTHPSYATAYENIGDIYAKMASEAYNQALQLDRGNVAAREKLSLINDLFSASRTQIAAAQPADSGPVQEPASPQPAPTPQTVIAENAPSLAASAAPAASPGPAAPPAQVKPQAPVAPSAAVSPPPAEVTATSSAAPAPVTPIAPEPGVAVAAPAPQAKAAGPVAAPAPPPDPRHELQKDIVSAVRSWANAWSAQDVDRYLSSYAAEYTPPGGLSRGDWEAQRRKRLTDPKYIKVEIAGIQVHALGNGQARASFRQKYQSDTYSDQVRKTLLLKKNNGVWQIVEERSE
jgi:tetratricopeptide (TPR) repeat protein